MTVESATYISQLNSALPADSDEIPEGDNHLRLMKAALLTSVGSLGAAALTVTAAQVNDVVNKAPIASPALTGTPTAPTAASGTGTTQIATTEFVAAAIGAVNAQTALSMSEDASASVSGSVGTHKVCTNAASVTFQLPAGATAGQRCKATFTNALTSNVIDPGAEKLFGVAGTRTVNARNASVEFTYVNATIGWVYA